MSDPTEILRSPESQMTLADKDLDALASALNASGRYRVLRRLDPRPFIETPDGSETRLGLFLDVETTGLDPAHDEIIELAMVPFTYALDGRIFEIHEAFQKLRDPGRPIPPEITAITGITDEMVAGQTLDAADVTAFASSAALVVAHNAAFDRRFAERLSEVFIAKPWACSMTQIDWNAEGFEGIKLAYLAMGAGFFYDRHRAKHDCVAAIELLATRLHRRPVQSPPWPNFWSAPVARIGVFGPRTRLSTSRIGFKARGYYRWNGDGTPNHWQRCAWVYRCR